MSDPDDRLRRFGEETSPDDKRRRRVRDRIATDDQLDGLLRQLPGPKAGAAERVRAGLMLPPRRNGAPWVALPLALAAGWLLAVATNGGPQTDPTVPTVAPQVLSGQAEPSDGVRLTYEGRGDVRSHERGMDIAWESGTLEVEVEPGRGLEVAVRTREAEVTVIGTAFEVERTPLGTEIRVDHGAVRVKCRTGQADTLGPGERILCLPHTAAGLLGRAQRQRSLGAAPAEVLATLESGLALPSDEPATRAEIEVQRIWALTETEQPARALAAADAYLDQGHALRRDEVLVLAARLAYGRDGCTAALRYLDQTESSDADPELSQRCARGEDGGN